MNVLKEESVMKPAHEKGGKVLLFFLPLLGIGAQQILDELVVLHVVIADAEELEVPLFGQPFLLPVSSDRPWIVVMLDAVDLEGDNRLFLLVKDQVELSLEGLGFRQSLKHIGFQDVPSRGVVLIDGAEVAHGLPEFGFPCAVVGVADFDRVLLIGLDLDVSVGLGKANELGQVILPVVGKILDGRFVREDDVSLLRPCGGDVDEFGIVLDPVVGALGSFWRNRCREDHGVVFGALHGMDGSGTDVLSSVFLEQFVDEGGLIGKGGDDRDVLHFLRDDLAHDGLRFLIACVSISLGGSDVVVLDHMKLDIALSVWGTGLDLAAIVAVVGKGDDLPAAAIVIGKKDEFRNVVVVDHGREDGILGVGKRRRDMIFLHQVVVGLLVEDDDRSELRLVSEQEDRSSSGDGKEGVGNRALPGFVHDGEVEFVPGGSDFRAGGIGAEEDGKGIVEQTDVVIVGKIALEFADAFPLIFDSTDLQQGLIAGSFQAEDAFEGREVKVLKKGIIVRDRIAKRHNVFVGYIRNAFMFFLRLFSFLIQKRIHLVINAQVFQQLVNSIFCVPDFLLFLVLFQKGEQSLHLFAVVDEELFELVVIRREGGLVFRQVSDSFRGLDYFLRVPDSQPRERNFGVPILEAKLSDDGMDGLVVS